MRAARTLALAVMLIAAQLGCGDKAPPPDNVPPPASHSQSGIHAPGSTIHADGKLARMAMDSDSVKIAALG